MIIIDNLSELKGKLRETEGKRVGFVPTMGALHEGHLSLINACREENDVCIVSIFVNPLQFSINEDFGKYPRTLELDSQLCKSKNVDIIFAPSQEAMYEDKKNNSDETIKVMPPESMTKCLCGISRPHFFSGVLTVVLKLFNIVKPTRAYFGEKDFQQFLLVRKMAHDFNLDVEVIGMPIIREIDGLAKSSRNAYLSVEHRALAPSIYADLKKSRELILFGHNAREVTERIKQHGNYEYFEARNPETLKLSDELPLRLFDAKTIGNTRLIDNLSV